MANKKSKEVIIKNICASSCSFIPADNIYPIEILPECEGGIGFPMDFDHLRKSLMTSVGLQKMFELNMLSVDDEYRTELRLLPANSLIRSYDDIKEMLLSGTNEELEDYLNEIADEANEKDCLVMQELICKVAIDIKLPNTVKLKLIEDYTGKCVADVLEELMRVETTQEKEEKPKKKSNKKKPVFEE